MEYCYILKNKNCSLKIFFWFFSSFNTVPGLHNKYESISFILSKRRLNKFRRDGLDIRKAIMISRENERNFQKLTEIDTNSNSTDNVNSGRNMPSNDLMNMDKNNNILSEGLKSVCSKGLSYVPVPLHYIG